MRAESGGKRLAAVDDDQSEMLAYMLIAQRDSLEYSTGDASHVSPEFPGGYWPATPEPPSGGAWDDSVARFRADRDALAKIVNDESVDLFARIPHGNATMLAQILLAADHNTYHLGQLVLVLK